MATRVLRKRTPTPGAARERNPAPFSMLDNQEAARLLALSSAHWRVIHDTLYYGMRHVQAKLGLSSDEVVRLCHGYYDAETHEIVAPESGCYEVKL